MRGMSHIMQQAVKISEPVFTADHHRHEKAMKRILMMMMIIIIIIIMMRMMMMMMVKRPGFRSASWIVVKARFEEDQ